VPSLQPHHWWPLLDPIIFFLLFKHSISSHFDSLAERFESVFGYTLWTWRSLICCRYDHFRNSISYNNSQRPYILCLFDHILNLKPNPDNSQLKAKEMHLLITLRFIGIAFTSNVNNILYNYNYFANKGYNICVWDTCSFHFIVIFYIPLSLSLSFTSYQLSLKLLLNITIFLLIFFIIYFSSYRKPIEK
jgi:hypothetical protein